MSRFDNNNDFEILNTCKDVTDKLQQVKDKLIVILFNVRYPERDSLEPRMKNWRKTYADVQFYKCIVVDGEQDLKKEYKIKEPPAVIFFRDGKELERISNFIESDPSATDTKDLKGDSTDEKRLKGRITYLCTNVNK